MSNNKSERAWSFITIRLVPRALKRAFKAHCDLRGYTLRGKLIAMIREELRKTGERP